MPLFSVYGLVSMACVVTMDTVSGFGLMCEYNDLIIMLLLYVVINNICQIQ